MFKKGVEMDHRIENLKEATTFLLIVLMIILIRTYVITPAIIHGDSMEPTLHDRDLVFLNKYAKDFERFDIIVHRYEDASLVKRVIGLPGEHVAYIDSKLYINGSLFPETFLINGTDDFDLFQLNYDKIPEEYYFVLGDNRQFSKDSRSIGLIHRDDILGKTNFRVYPFKNIGQLN